MVKKFFFFYIIINLFSYLYANPYKIIVTVNNDPITEIDLDYEMKILSILNNRDISKQQVSIALNNLIEESIKKKEITNEKLKIDNSLINNHFLQISKNLNLNLNNIDQNLIFLIKEKIEIDKLWNNLIIKKYGWKISINMNEIDQKLKEKYKENYSNQIKDNLILEEKTKKLGVFSRYHLNKLKEQSLIKFYK